MPRSAKPTLLVALLVAGSAFLHGQTTTSVEKLDAILNDLPKLVPELPVPKLQRSFDSVTALYASVNLGYATAASSLSVRVYPYSSLANAEQGFSRTLNMLPAPYDRMEMRHGMTLYWWDNSGPIRVLFQLGTSVVEIGAPIPFTSSIVTKVSEALINEIAGPASSLPINSGQSGETMRMLLLSQPVPGTVSVTSVQEGRAEVAVEIIGPGATCLNAPPNPQPLSGMRIQVSLLRSDGGTTPQRTEPTRVAVSNLGCAADTMQFHFESTRPAAPVGVVLTVNGKSSVREISSPVPAILAAIRAFLDQPHQPRRTFVLGDRLTADVRAQFLATGAVVEMKNLPDSTRDYYRIDAFEISWNYATVKLVRPPLPVPPGMPPAGCGETSTFTLEESKGRWTVGQAVSIVC